VIILDTNQLEHAQPPDGPLIAMLRTLASQTGQRLGLPEIVLEEHLSHYRRDIHSADVMRVAASRELRKLYPAWSADVSHLNVGQAVMDRTHRLQQAFQILQTPEWAARDALLREAKRELPASTALDVSGAGGRDAAIWLTAVAQCLAGEDVYFVSTDKAAFGERTLKAELVSEIQRRMPQRPQAFHYCYGVDVLLNELAAVHSGTPSLAVIGASPAVQDAVLDAMEEARLVSELAVAAAITSMGRYLPDHRSLKAVGMSGPSMAYDIGGTVWACSRVRWAAKLLASVGLGGDLWRGIEINYKLHTTLVMRLAGDGSIEAAEVSARSQPFDVLPLLAGRAET
jgi:hypothetical protein